MLPYIALICSVLVPIVLHCHRMTIEHEEKFRPQWEKVLNGALNFIIRWGPVVAATRLILLLLYAPSPFGRSDTASMLALLFIIIALGGARFALTHIDYLKSEEKYLKSSHELSQSVYNTLKSHSQALRILYAHIEIISSKLPPEEREQLNQQLGGLKSEILSQEE